MDDTELADGWEQRYREALDGMYRIGKLAGKIEYLQDTLKKMEKSCKDGQRVRETKG